MSDMKDLNRELTDDELELFAGGKMDADKEKQLIFQIRFAKMVGWSMEKCIEESCKCVSEEVWEENTSFITANWNNY